MIVNMFSNQKKNLECKFPEESLNLWDHVYFVHPSTDLSVDMSTDTRPMYRSTYRPILDRYAGQNIGQASVNMLADN